MENSLVFDMNQFELARLDAYERTIPELLNRVRYAESIIHEVRNDLSSLISKTCYEEPNLFEMHKIMHKLDALFQVE